METNSTSKTIIASGYFNPLHVGHLEYLENAKKLGNKLIVIVNNDIQVGLKGSVPFMTSEDRCKIVKALKCVDEALVSIDLDRTVTKTLQHIMKSEKDCLFAKGGDSVMENTPEIATIKTVFNVGGGKIRSSSDYIKNSIEYKK